MIRSGRILLLGTGTDVGKTYVGAALARAWRERRGPSLALKPIESGIASSLQSPKLDGRTSTQANLHERVHLDSDAGQLQAAATWGAPPLYSFVDPVSPHLAAEREGRNVDLGEIVSWVEATESSLEVSDDTSGGISLVETAGGVFSPLSHHATNFDLARSLDSAFWILVAPDSVGVLHDLGAALRAMNQRSPDLVVLSGAREPDATTGTNAHELLRTVFPQLRAAAPRSLRVGKVERGGSGAELVDLVASLMESK